LKQQIFAATVLRLWSIRYLRVEALGELIKITVEHSAPSFPANLSRQQHTLLAIKVILRLFWE
jgi:hypothetical protein